MKYQLSFLFFLFVILGNAQENFGIQFPNSSQRSSVCGYFEQAFQNKPKESSFVIKRENNQLFFETNDDRWVKQLFKNPQDGIAVDIVSKDRYACDTRSESSQIKGKLFEPVYTKEIKRGLKPYENKRYTPWNIQT